MLTHYSAVSSCFFPSFLISAPFCYNFLFYFVVAAVAEVVTAIECYCCCCCSSSCSCSSSSSMAEFKAPYAENQKVSKILSCTPGVGQTISCHVSPAAGNPDVIFCFHGTFSFIFANPLSNNYSKSRVLIRPGIKEFCYTLIRPLMATG